MQNASKAQEGSIRAPKCIPEVIKCALVINKEVKRQFPGHSAKQGYLLNVYFFVEMLN